jgi:hypothetical protein
MNQKGKTMSDPELVGYYADTGYARLTAGGSEGFAQLARSGRVFGVLADRDGRPVLVLTRDGRAPLVMIDAMAPMRRTIAADIVSLLNGGVPGLVVVRDSRVTGILSADAVASYLVRHTPTRSGLMGDEQLHGDAPVTDLTLACSTCGTVNTVPYFVAGHTRCSQGHPLTITWD